MWAGCKVGKLQSRERMENQTKGFVTLCNQQLQSRRKCYLKVHFQKPFVFTPVSCTEQLTFSHYFLPLLFIFWLKCWGFGSPGTHSPPMHFLSKTGQWVTKALLAAEGAILAQRAQEVRRVLSCSESQLTHPGQPGSPCPTVSPTSREMFLWPSERSNSHPPSGLYSFPTDSTIETKSYVKIYTVFKQSLQSSALFKFTPINKLGAYRLGKKSTLIWFCLISKSYLQKYLVFLVQSGIL